MSKSANGSAASGGTQVGHNLTAMKKQIKDDLTKILQLREDENDTRKDKKTVADRLEKLGIPKSAQNLVIKYMGMEDDERRNFDTAIEIAREAMGLPQQISMDEWLKENQGPDKKAKAAPAAAEAGATA